MLANGPDHPGSLSPSEPRSRPTSFEVSDMLHRSLIAALTAAACSSYGLVIYEKRPDTSGSAYISQDFPDFPSYSTATFDDVHLAWPSPLGRISIYGLELGDPAFNEGVFLGIGTAPGYDAITKIYPGAYVAQPRSSTASPLRGNLEFDLAGDVYSGTIWVSAWVRRPYSNGGQWFWLVNSRTVDWSENYGHNPGGGLGLGSDPFPWRYNFGMPADSAMTVRYAELPEPAALAAMALGLAVFGRWRFGRNVKPPHGARRI
ncbi:MAG: hypothetical protein HONBIEJF_00418 [Fimbriimonadaceae bacterium]|nr:hypothetical protein [Fimbriimonadaceae bacterium]